MCTYIMCIYRGKFNYLSGKSLDELRDLKMNPSTISRLQIFQGKHFGRSYLSIDWHFKEYCYLFEVQGS